LCFEGGEVRYAIVNVSTADVRRRPDHKSEMVSQGLLGSVVRLEGEAVGDGWFPAVLADGYEGWMRSWNLVTVSRARAREWLSRARSLVVSAWEEVLASPRAGSRRVRDLVLGCKVSAGRRKGRWVQVRLPDGGSGWVRAPSLAGKPLPAEGKAVVRTARRFLGAPYLWGGVSPKGADCSGLVQTAFAVHGIALPRDVADQIGTGRAVGLAEVSPGDLLFFARKGRRPSHVALLAGRGRVIHAGSPVQETELGGDGALGSGPGELLLVCARRVL